MDLAYNVGHQYTLRLCFGLLDAFLRTSELYEAYTGPEEGLMKAEMLPNNGGEIHLTILKILATKELGGH